MGTSCVSQWHRMCLEMNILKWTLSKEQNILLFCWKYKVSNYFSWRTFYLWMKYAPCHISKQKCFSHLAITLQPCHGELWGNSGWRQLGCWLPSPQSLQSPPVVDPEGIQDGTRVLAPDSWGAYKRNDFSEPRLLYPSISRQLPTSLTLDICVFFLIKSNLLMFQLPGLCCKNS